MHISVKEKKHKKQNYNYNDNDITRLHDLKTLIDPDYSSSNDDACSLKMDMQLVRCYLIII